MLPAVVTEMVLPSRAKFLVDRSLPISPHPLVQNAPATQRFISSETELPNRANDVTQSELPTTSSPRTLKDVQN